MSAPADFEVHQEQDAVNAGRLIRVAAVGIAVAVAAVVGAGVLVVAQAGALRPSHAGPGGPAAARREISQVEQTPILDVQAGIDRRDAQRRELESWGWVDRQRGIAKIPVDQAMDVVVRKGMAP